MTAGPAALWALIAGTAVTTVAIKAFGPVVLGGRSLPVTFTKVLVLLPPVVLAAIVATSALTDGSSFQVDARTVGVLVAAVLLWRRHHLLLAVVVAATATALLRLVGVP